jgi:RHS repeat-associated protein
LESEKDPLEGRIWYNYPGQSTNLGAPYYLDAAYTGASGQASVVARVLDDGTTQLSSFGYNAAGKVTYSIDPMGRMLSYDYATNNIDLIGMRMTRNGKNEVLMSATYDAQHLPLTLTDPAGQTVRFTYNSRGQLLTVTDAKNSVSTLTYDSNGFLVSFTGPLQGTSDVATFTYDSYGRLRTTTNTAGYAVTVDYDVFDRPIARSFPDGTSEQFVYDKLDLAAVKDRLGRWRTNTFNANRRVTSIRDPLGRLTMLDWCTCGLLSAITDPLGRTISWTYDLQSRPVSKHYPDGSSENYVYENSISRIRMVTDPAGLQKLSEYNVDNSLKRVSYPNAPTPTPAVSFTYDPDYPRLASVQDGIGTTVYSYYPVTSSPSLGAGQLQSLSGPLPDSTVSFQYDELGRVLARAINGVAENLTYDPLGRILSITNSLGIFHYTYDGATRRVASAAYPNGQSKVLSYYDPAGDLRLKEIKNLKPDGSLLSSCGYSYNPAGQITSWTNQWDSLPEQVWILSYDAGDQLTAAIRAVTGSNIPLTNNYSFDLAGNRVRAANNVGESSSSFNALNQLVSCDDPTLTDNVTYEWDAAHHLTAVNQGTQRTEFTYDGWDRRVRILEKTNGTVVSDNYFLWCGTEICEERDSSGAIVVRRFFRQGETIASSGGASNLYYTRDHLGSVREATDTAGALQARYDYDPYGQQSAYDERIAPSFAFTGHYRHKPTGLYLALYRGLDPRLGRWVGRDPSGEFAGLNLYSYVRNNPVNASDPFGLLLLGIQGSAEAEAGVGFGAGGQVSAGVGIATGNSPLEILGALEVGVLLFNPITAGFGVAALAADRIQAYARGTKPVFGIGGYLSEGTSATIPCKTVNMPSKARGTASGLSAIPFSPGVTAGASAGLSGGAFISNATSFDQLNGPFLTFNLNTPIFGLSLGVDPNSGTFILSGGIGPSAGLSASLYATDTVSGQF